MQFEIQKTAFGQMPDGPTPTPASFELVWEKVWETCRAWLPEDQCRMLLGYTPFVCPTPPEQRPVTSQWWFWLLVGLGAGIVVGDSRRR